MNQRLVIPIIIRQMFEYSLAFVAHIFSQSSCFFSGITIMAQSAILYFQTSTIKYCFQKKRFKNIQEKLLETHLITNEAAISQFLVACFTAETLWMPTSCHGLYNASDYEFTAFVATWCKQNMKITFTIFATFKLVENTILESSETLSASL